MLDNYSLDDNGVIFQINKNPFVYDSNYVDQRYNTYGILNDSMSHLRLGYVVGAIGRLPSSIMDVGYGNGSFISVCSSVIKKCYGADKPPFYPLPNHIQTITDIYSQYFEVITFFDSLEHFDDIYQISNLKCKFIVISVPWCHYLSDAWFEHWKHRRPDEHLWHFNLESLIKFMKFIGFDCISYSNIEDSIRKPYDPNLPNILSAVFVRS